MLFEMEASTTPGTEEDFKPQKANAKRGSTSGEMWKIDIGKDWISTQQQSIAKQVTSDPLERGATRNTARPWWIETTKELESCLKKFDCGISRKRRNCAAQQRDEVNKLELGNQPGRNGRICCWSISRMR